MSGKITVIAMTGTKDVDLDVSYFWGGDKKGQMLQLTQGFGGMGEPGFIHLTVLDTDKLIKILVKWLKDMKGDN